jgi:integrase
MSIYKRGKKYYIDIRFNGKRYRTPSPDKTLAGAQSYEAILRRRLAQGEEINNKSDNTILFSTFVDDWLNTYVKNNNKPSEQLSKKMATKNHLKPFFGKMKLADINSLDVEKFKQKKQIEGKCNKSINNYLAMLSKCLSCAEEWDVIQSIPKIKMLKVPPQSFNFLTEEEYNSLLYQAKKISNDFYNMVLFTLRTGVRIGELMGLKWEDIDFQRKNVTIKRSIVNNIVGSPKNNKERTIPLSNDIYNILAEERNKKDEYVFLGKIVSRFSLNRSLKKACKHVGVRIKGWHDLRHSFASKLANNGVSLQVIQSLLGHSGLKMTQRYAHLEPSTLSNAINTLTPNNIVNPDYGHNMVTPDKQKPKPEAFNKLNNSYFNLKINKNRL